MKNLLHIICLCCLLLSSAYGDEESMDVWKQIDDLEKQKPLVQATIDYAKEQIPLAEQAKKDVNAYGSKMQEVLTTNNYKAMASGGINIVLEVTGAGNKGKLVDLGAWLVGKGIGIAMETSKTMGGEPFYKKKIEGISSTQKNLTNELDKLYKISHSSDEAMKSYFNKYGKYSDSFEIGDIGIFTQRMRLITEQASASEQSLDALLETLNRTLTDAETEMREIERTLALLKEQLAQLNQKDKEKTAKEEKKSIELSDKDTLTAIVKPKENPSISLPGYPQGCSNTYKTQDESQAVQDTLTRIADQAQSEQDTLTKFIIERENDQAAYQNEILAKLTAIEELFWKEKEYLPYSLSFDAVKDMKRGHFPSGASYKTFLEQTHKAYDIILKKTEEKIASHRALADSILANIPIQHDDKIAQGMTNVGILLARYTDVSSKCWQSPRYLYLDNSRSPSDDIVNSIKAIKVSLLNTIAKEEQSLEESTKYVPQQLLEMERYLANHKIKMGEQIVSFESKMEKKIAHEKILMGAIGQLQAKYKNSGFTHKQINGINNYIFIVNGDLEDTLCKTMGKITSSINGSGIESVISLENKVKLLLELSKVYSVDGLPSEAYIEAGINPSDVSARYEKHNQAYIESFSAYVHSGSNSQMIVDSLNNNAFHMLASYYPNSLFDKFYKAQIQKAKEISHSLKNLKVEITALNDADKIHISRQKELTEYYESIRKTFKENFSCISLDTPVIKGLAEELDTTKELLEKLKNKPTYMDGTELIASLKTIHTEAQNFQIDLEYAEGYQKTYLSLKERIGKFHAIVFGKQGDSIFPSDKQELTRLLLEAESFMNSHDDYMNTRSESNQQNAITQLYVRFAQEYSNKNLSGLMSLLSDEWMSSGDGTTLMDLENTLSNSFSIFNEITCEIGSLYITSSGNNLYTVTYTITIQGINYENDIKHIEKSTVTEEVSIIDGKPKILKTLNGKFWTVR